MDRFAQLTQRVKQLYEAKDPNRAPWWADWLYAEHVPAVAAYAKKLAEAKGANVELAQAAAILHDIADAKLPGRTATHEAESLKMAHELMQACGYTADEITLVVDDALKLHSCHGNDRPSSKEGLILATADALAHLETDFYLCATWRKGAEGQPFDEVKAWVLEKIERDLTIKIAFDDVREQAQPSYHALKLLFSR